MLFEVKFMGYKTCNKTLCSSCHKLEIELCHYQNPQRYQLLSVYVGSVTQVSLRLKIILCLNVKNNVIKNALYYFANIFLNANGTVWIIS